MKSFGYQAALPEFSRAYWLNRYLATPPMGNSETDRLWVVFYYSRSVLLLDHIPLLFRLSR
ncbi:Uncharacterised protein [Vibrio cholerae]|nr:Uncharacterised protein [Vibrio cholerae]